MIQLQYFLYDDREKNYLKQKDIKLGAIIDQVGHIYREVNPDLFTALIQTIVDQQISTKAAKTIWERLIDKYGKLAPEKLAAAEPGDIQKTGLTMIKAVNIKTISQKVASGELDLESLHNMPDDQVCRELTKLRGVGPWTAEMLMLFSMQRKNILSYGDLAIHRGLCRLYNHSGVDKKLFLEYKELYSPYASTASLYLWAIAGGALDKE